MRKYLVFLLFVLMLPLTIHAQTKKINRLKVERTVMQKKINESEQLLNTTKKDVRSQLNNLLVLNTQIGEQQKYVEGIQNEMVVLTNNLSVLEKELSVLQQELNIVKQKYHRAVLYTFRNKLLNNKWLFILNARSFNDMYRRMRYVNNYSKYQKVQGEIIREKEEAIQKKKNQILGIKTEKNQLLVEGRQQQQALHGKRVQQQQVVNELNQKQKELQTSIAQQRQKYASLNAQIDRLIQAEIAAAARRRAAEEAARKAAAEKARKAAAEAAARKKKHAVPQQQKRQQPKPPKLRRPPKKLQPKQRQQRPKRQPQRLPQLRKQQLRKHNKLAQQPKLLQQKQPKLKRLKQLRMLLTATIRQNPHLPSLQPTIWTAPSVVALQPTAVACQCPSRVVSPSPRAMALTT